MSPESFEDMVTSVNTESTSIESQSKTLKRGLDLVGLTEPSFQKHLNEDHILPPTKIGRFELNEEGNNAQTVEFNLPGYASKYIQNFMSNQALTEGILKKNPISTDIKSENLDSYLR